MNKIKIKLNISNLNAIISILTFYDNGYEPQNFTFKAVLSISEELYTKLMKKSITERKNDKIFTISLKYYEAFALESILRHFIEKNKNLDI